MRMRPERKLSAALSARPFSAACSRPMTRDCVPCGSKPGIHQASVPDHGHSKTARGRGISMRDRLAPKKVHAPETVGGVADALVDVDPERLRDDARNAPTAEPRTT